MLTINQRDYLSRLAGAGHTRVADPRLLDAAGRPRWRMLDTLKALGYVQTTIKARGNLRTLWVSITSAGTEALQCQPSN